MARTSSRTEKVYRSKIDAWILAIMIAVLAALTIGMIAALAIGDWMHAAQRFFVSLGIGGLVVWVMIGTHYTLSGRDLVVRSGPFSWRIDIGTISSVAPVRGVGMRIRSSRSSPALSLDRLEIVYGNNKRLFISPAERDAFMKDITARRPSI